MVKGETGNLTSAWEKYVISIQIINQSHGNVENYLIRRLCQILRTKLFDPRILPLGYAWTMQMRPIHRSLIKDRTARERDVEAQGVADVAEGRKLSRLDDSHPSDPKAGPAEGTVRRFGTG